MKQAVTYLVNFSQGKCSLGHDSVISTLAIVRYWTSIVIEEGLLVWGRGANGEGVDIIFCSKSQGTHSSVVNQMAKLENIESTDSVARTDQDSINSMIAPPLQQRSSPTPLSYLQTNFDLRSLTITYSNFCQCKLLSI